MCVLASRPTELSVKHIGPALLYYLVPTLFGPLGVAVAGEPTAGSTDAHVPVQELRLANGMTVLLVPQPESTTVAVGWMVRAGSADDAHDQTGLSHLLEHMMFKGSRTVGSRDLEREIEALAGVDRAWNDRRKLLAKLEKASPRKRPRLSEQLDGATSSLETAQTHASSLAFLGQYSFLYSEQGATGLNANTYRDMTLYYVTLPSEKLEVWFWLESDRLLAPVFRQFYREVQVIHEERRQRIESTPTGLADEELRGLFWGRHPYAWDPLGRSGDLDRLSRQDALEFYRRHYRTDQMTLALVGGFDPGQVKSWARRYFARLPAPSGPIPRGPRQALPTPSEEKRLVATCACPPQVRIYYPTASFGETDAYVLQLLSAVLNGRTGRLYRSLVLDQQIAFSAYTQQISWAQAGEFSFRAESKGTTDPASLIRAWDQQIDLLRAGAPAAEEILRARNRSTADAFRALKDPEALMKQLLIYQGLGDWRYLNRWSERIQDITSEDLVRVANEHLLSERRTVAIYRRPEGRTEP